MNDAINIASTERPRIRRPPRDDSNRKRSEVVPPVNRDLENVTARNNEFAKEIAPDPRSRYCRLVTHEMSYFVISIDILGVAAFPTFYGVKLDSSGERWYRAFSTAMAAFPWHRKLLKKYLVTARW